MTIQRWKLTIEYDGTDYSGWQAQDDAIPSVQRDIEKAITKFCGQDISVYAAGRTDAGVHAWGQVLHFDLDYGDRDLSEFDLAKALNAHLRPKPVAVINAKKVSDDFHARFQAKNKLYRYRIVTRSSSPVIERRTVWHLRYDLDIEAMKAAAKFLLGYHDFSSFRDSQCQSKSPMKTLDRLDVFSEDYDDFNGRHIWLELEAQSFLHHQCRNIVGTLVDVGKGKKSAKDVKDILSAKDRTKAGMTAPGSGLCLVRINYKD